jgi:serine/threonine-protein kinase
MRALFAREVQSCSHLQHANIVDVIGHGIADGAPFIVMEHLVGVNFYQAERRTRGIGSPMSVDIACHGIAQVAAGLHHAHELRHPDGSPMQLVHRDISPDNMMLLRSGRAKLLDFGVAKSFAVRDARRLTATGELRGKLHFMSPEQVEGAVLDRRADLFSLGATLYFLLTGVMPFERRTDLATLAAILQDRPLAPEMLRRNLPKGLNGLVMALLEKRPSDRPSDASEVAQLLPTFACEGAEALAQALVEELLEAEELDAVTRDDLRGPVPEPVSATRAEAPESGGASERMDDAGETLGDDFELERSGSTDVDRFRTVSRIATRDEGVLDSEEARATVTDFAVLSVRTREPASAPSMPTWVATTTPSDDVSAPSPRVEEALADVAPVPTPTPVLPRRRRAAPPIPASSSTSTARARRAPSPRRAPSAFLVGCLLAAIAVLGAQKLLDDDAVRGALSTLLR